MKTNKIFALIIATVLASCGGSEDSSTPKQGGPKTDPTPVTTTLKATATFPIGNIVSANKLSGTDEQFKTILNKEFNSITAENDMKMGEMFRAIDTYDWSKGDAIVAYAKANNLRVHGHALVWHSSIPSWLNTFSGTDAAFEEQVKKYIKATVTHFALAKTTAGKSVVESWDVVNEAFTSEAPNAVFAKRMGTDYVSKCFKWAREADATVKLFYNDYNLDSDGTKVANVVAMANAFKANGTPINGIGSQMHIDYLQPTLSTMTNHLNSMIGTGLLIHFSELDITVNKDKTLTALTVERAAAEKARYKEIAILYKTIPVAQRFGITLWGMRDSDSWLLSFNNNPNEWPLLFNASYGYKEAYTGFLEGLK